MGFDMVTGRRISHHQVDYDGKPKQELEGITHLQWSTVGQLHLIMLNKHFQGLGSFHLVGPIGGDDDLYFKHYAVTDASEAMNV